MTEAADDAPQFLPTQSEARGRARRGLGASLGVSKSQDPMVFPRKISDFGG